jgi:hypothetical protein
MDKNGFDIIGINKDLVKYEETLFVIAKKKK